MARPRSAALVLLAVACNGAPPKASPASTPETGPPTAAAPTKPAASDAGPRKDAPSIRVATYNVNFGMAGDRETIELIRSLDADLVFLQETNPEWTRSLRRELGEAFPHMKFRKHSWPAGGQAVLSRHPLGAEAWLKPPTGHFPAWRVLVESPLGTLQVLSVHLDPPSLSAKSQGWLQAYQRSQEVHLREVTSHADALDPDLPTLVVGDFNEDVSGKAIVWLRERGFAPAIDEFVPTWRWHTRRGTVRWQLDHVLCGPRLRIAKAEVVEGGNSDHQPIVAVVTPSWTDE